MKKVIYRIFAFVLDILLVNLIIYGINSLDVINFNSREINYKYKMYYNNINKYNNLTTSIGTYFEDNKIDELEYNEIKTNYSYYLEVFDDIKVNEEMQNKDIETIKEKIDIKNNEIKNKYTYEINRLSALNVIVSIIIYILYFGVLQYFLKGQTLFKRLFRLKVVNAKDKKRKVILASFILRSILITEIIFSVLNLFFLFKVNYNNYINISFWLNEIEYFYEILFIIVMIMHNDNRSVHDLILNTKVIRYDKAGIEIKEQLFNDEKNTHKTN